MKRKQDLFPSKTSLNQYGALLRTFQGFGIEATKPFVLEVQIDSHMEERFEESIGSYQAEVLSKRFNDTRTGFHYELQFSNSGLANGFSKRWSL